MIPPEPVGQEGLGADVTQGGDTGAAQSPAGSLLSSAGGTRA